MGLFDRNNAGAPKTDKTQQLMAKYGLEDVDPMFAPVVRDIANELLGTGAMEAGLKLSLAKAEIQLPISYQHVLIEQNWIIIRQLDQLCKLLEQR